MKQAASVVKEKDKNKRCADQNAVHIDERMIAMVTPRPRSIQRPMRPRNSKHTHARSIQILLVTKQLKLHEAGKSANKREKKDMKM